MSSGGDSDNTQSELLVAIQGSVSVQETEGRKFVRFRVDPSLQGHTFAVELKPSEVAGRPVGPFRIEYVLGTEFLIHENELLNISLEQGYSYLTVTPELPKAIILEYIDEKNPTPVKEAQLSLKSSNGLLQRIVVDTPETDITLAIRHTGQIVGDFLDALSFAKRVPIAVRHIEVYAQSQQHLRRYITFPYLKKQITITDLTRTAEIPSRLRPALRLFREGLSSNKPHYRLLCLYRVREVLESLRQKNDQQVLAAGGTPDRPRRVLPDNKLTRCYFPAYVGKKVGAFLDHVRSEYRLSIAHAKLSEFLKLTLDPADVRIDHRVDFTNAALIPVIADLIQDEIDFINRHKLESPRREKDQAASG